MARFCMSLHAVCKEILWDTLSSSRSWSCACGTELVEVGESGMVGVLGSVNESLSSALMPGISGTGRRSG